MLDLAPLARRSVVDETFDLLRARILHGQWGAGERLPTEQELCDALRVSRSTVREALNRLASAGLVEIPHGGTKRVLDWRDHAGLEVLSSLVIAPDGSVATDVVRSVTEMRAALAPSAAALAARRRTDDQARELCALTGKLAGQDSLEALLLVALDWWSVLVLASDNLAYRLAFNTLLSTATDRRPALLPVLGPELHAHGAYAAVTDAVVRRDEAAAERSCRELVALGSDAILSALETLP